MLRFEGLSVRRAGTGSGSTDPESPEDFLFRDLDITLQEGGSLGIIGPNGSGKSTLIKCINGIHRDYDGVVTLTSDPKIGYMPQNYRSAVLSWLTIDEHFNLSLDAEGRAKALGFLTEIGFRPTLDRRLANLSGGEIQLILLSTLIGQDCRLLLVDEPLSAVDFIRRGRALDVLINENRVAGRTVIMVSHHLEDAKRLCERVVVLSGRENDTPRIAACTPNLKIGDLFAL